MRTRAPPSIRDVGHDLRMDSRMQNNVVTIGAAVVGLVFLILAGVYWTHTADSLPAFLPGHVAGDAHVHFKHGIGSLVLALALFAFAWFSSGRKTT